MAIQPVTGLEKAAVQAPEKPVKAKEKVETKEAPPRSDEVRGKSEDRRRDDEAKAPDREGGVGARVDEDA